MIDNMIVSTLSMLVWAYFAITNFSDMSDLYFKSCSIRLVDTSWMKYVTVNVCPYVVCQIFFALMNINIIVTCFHRFFMTCIHRLFHLRRTWSCFLALITICTWSIFMFFHFIVACTHYVDALWFFFIHRINFKFICFFDVFCSNNFEPNSLGTYENMLIAV